MKKVFLFLTMLLFTFTGTMKAANKRVEVGTASTTSSYIPTYTYCDYSVTQQIFTPAELQYAGTINAISFEVASGTKTRDLNVYMTHVTRSAFSGTSDWEQLSQENMVVSAASVSFAPGWVTINLDTPFEYNGTDNLLLCVQDVTGTWASAISFKAYTANSGAIRAYRDASSYDVTNLSGGAVIGYKNHMMIDMEVEIGPTAMMVTPSPIEMGERPIGAWMRPQTVTITNDGNDGNVTLIESNNNFFTVDAQTPISLAYGESSEIKVGTGTGNAGNQNGQLMVAFSDAKGFTTVDISAMAYAPATADVWEKAQVVSAMPYSGNVTTAGLHQNYVMGQVEGAVDAVYKVTFDQDVMFSAGTNGENAVTKVYTEDFNGVGGPDENNNYVYTGPQVGPGPMSLWWNYEYEGSMVHLGYSTPGTLAFGYMIPAAYLQEYNLGNCAITEVQSALGNFGGTYCDLFILKGGDTPDINNLVYYQGFTGFTPNNFFTLALDVPQFLGDDENIWIMFFTDNTRLVAGNGVVDAAGKLWYTRDVAGTWNNDPDRTAIINTHFLEIPTGREVAVNSTEINHRGFKASEVSQITESEATINGVSHAQIAAQYQNDKALIKNGHRNDSTQTSAVYQIENMFMPAGTYYVAVASTTRDFGVDMATAEIPAPEQSIVYTPYDGETDVVAPCIAQWILGDYTTEMQVLFGTQYPPQTPLIDWTSNLVESAIIMDLEPNQSYFLQVNGRNATGTTMGEIIAFITPIEGIDGLEVAASELYPGDAAVFSWPAATRSHKGYNLYMADGNDIVKVNESLIMSPTYTVENLGYNMSGYEFAVTAVYDAGESDYSNVVTVFMTGNGTVSGNVYDTDEEHPIASATVEFRGVDEYGADQVFTVTTDENGAFTGEIYAGNYEAVVVTDGYAEVTYPNVVVNYNEATEGINIITHEFYYPLSVIKATEEENDVLVEWSWTPSELFVDFETGDFSQANFVLPDTYPWAVTTSNPYEGTYAMKSTCEGVGNGVSSIEAVVDVPFDGLMGFWVKCSSETNFDKFRFYIDGVEKGSAISGNQQYTYKEYPVTEGTHTYKWEYAKDFSVNANDDCVYVDNIFLYKQAGPAPNGQVYNFDDGTMMGWTSIDADGDGYGWATSANPGVYHNQGVNLAGSGHNSSDGFVLSGSYANQLLQALTPDNYLVSPNKIAAQNGASIKFYACAQDANYASEHFGVAVSTTGNTSGNDFTTIQEWTMTAKGTGVSSQGRDGQTRAMGAWYEYTVDLSAYAGQEIWVAIRHFNCTDQFILNVDDIILDDGSDDAVARGGRSFVSYNLYRRNNVVNEEPTLIAEGIDGEVYSYVDNSWPTLPYGEYQWGIAATYDGYSPATTRDQSSYDFENGTMQGWTTIDADGDGYDWTLSTTLPGHNASSGCVFSNSFVNYFGPVNPNNYLVSPTKAAYSQVTFYACAQDSDHPEEHFGVAVSTGSNTNAADFTTIKEWTMTAKGTGLPTQGRDGQTRAEGAWYEYTADLSAYAGQEIWVAIRHFNCTDQFILKVDDITLTTGGGGPTPPTPPTPGPTGSGISEIIWSNMIEKDMESTMTFNVALNNGQSPLGAMVTVVNANENYTATVDENGMAELVVRKGVNDTITVSLAGYESFVDVEFIDADEYEYDVVLQEIIAPVEGLYVSPTGWAMWEGETPGSGPVPPTPGTNNSFTEDFENGLNGWTVLKVNADGGEWLHSDQNPGGYNYTTHTHGGTGFAMCYSFVDYVGSFNTNSYLITPQKYGIVNGSTLSFWADNANDDYPENFSVCVATADNPTAADFTHVWTGAAKGAGVKTEMRHVNGRYDNWRLHTIDLSAYAGQNVYIAFHDVNNDVYEIWIDDVELTPGRGDRAPLSYKVMLDGKYVGESYELFYQVPVEDMVEGSEHVVSVAPLYASGMGAWMEYTWTYTPCNNFDGVTSFNSTVDNNKVTLTWTMPNGPTPPPTPGEGQWYYYDNGVNVDAIGTGGGEFWWGVMFPAGSYTGNAVTKVAAFDYMAMAGDVTIYNDGTTSPATAVGTANVTFTGTNDFAEVEFATPVTIDPTKNLWVVYHNASGAAFPAAVCDNTGDANGRWVSLDGSDWGDMVSYGINNTFMVRAYVAQGAKGEVVEISVPQATGISGGTLANAGVAKTSPARSNRDNHYSFEGSLEGWTTIDADGDGNNWMLGSVLMAGYLIPAHDGEDCISSASYKNMPLTPDNYIVSPQGQYSSINFWACAQDPSYPAEHFGVAVSTTGNTSGNDFTTIQEWTMTAKEAGNTGNYASRSREGKEGTWYEYTVDLGAYAGQDIYVAIRHFNCSDMFYINVDDVTLTTGGGGPTPPTPPTPPTENTYDFEDGTMQGWTTIDADGDGYDWAVTTNLPGHNASTGCVFSNSFVNYVGPVNPNNYLVSPTKAEYSQIKFYACSQDSGYPAEHFGVAVSTGSNTNAADFTMVDEWTMTAKGTGLPTQGRDGQTRAEGAWYEYTVDLSAYAGQEIWVAIRHFNCTDQFILKVDDITLTTGGGSVPPQPTEGIIGTILYRNDEFVGMFDANVTSFVDEDLASGTYLYTIRVIYDGDYDVTYYAMSCSEEEEVIINVNVLENSEVINSIYPNPTRGDITIKATAMKQVTVFNSMGQMVLDQKVSGDNMVLNMGQFESGVYMVKVTTETGSDVKRISVVK